MAALRVVWIIWAQTVAHARWIASAWIVWGTALVVMAALIMAFWPPIAWPRMYLIGLLLQLVGIGLGVPALTKTRKLFGLLSFSDSVREWLKRRPRSPVIVALTGTVGMTSVGSAKLSIWSGMGPELEMAQRIDALIENVERLRKEATEANAEHAASIAKVRSEMDTRIRDTDIKLSNETRKLLESQTGGLTLARVALVLVILGTAIAGIASGMGSAWVS